MMEWKSNFKKHILERGFDYFCSDAVEEIEISKDGVTATVCGSEDYEVEIAFEKKGISDMYCSCPYAAGGNNCKHMAAVLFAWEEKEGLLEGEGELKLHAYIPEKRTDEEIEELLEQAEEWQLKTFVSHVLHRDERQIVVLKTLLNIEFAERDMGQLKRRIDATIDDYLEYDGFISYHQAYTFISEMEQYLDDDVKMLMKAGRHNEAFELSSYLFVEVSNVEMDDSDGGLSMFANHCVDIWEEILDQADEKTEEIIYRWMEANLSGKVVDYMEEYIEQVFMGRFTKPKYLAEKMDYAKKKIRAMQEFSNEWASKYEIEKWLSYQIDLMEKMGCPDEEIMVYCKTYWPYPSVRKYYVAKCEIQGNVEETIKTLKESIEIDAGHFGLVRQHSLHLKDLYRSLDLQENYTKQLWDLVTEHAPGDVEVFKELKALYSEKQWEEKREEIFSILPARGQVEGLYKEERLYDRLLQCVLAAPGLYLLQQYENDLKKDYAEEILQKYTDEVNEMAVHTADRKSYRQWISILRRMSNFQGGEEKVRQIAEDWKIRYKHRPAMMDELSKL